MLGLSYVKSVLARKRALDFFERPPLTGLS